MQNKHFPFWVLTASILIVLVVPVLIQDGMFMDGMLYTCVAKNLSEGHGSFWFPHFSKNMLDFFDQQPPLGFGIQAVFFKLFGASIYVERFYSFLTLCLGAFLISKLWKILFAEQSEIKNISWFPVLLWIIIPVCFWSYSNNMLECTMVVFDLLAVIFIFRFFEQRYILHLVIAGIFIFLASLTKGFQGLFPLAAIFFHWLVYRKISFVKMMLYSTLLLAVPSLIYFLIFQNDTARDGLTAYLQNRVLNSISSVSTVENRFHLIGRLSQELLPPIIISLLLFVFLRKKSNPEKKYLQHSLFFLLIGVSASLPLIVTLEQRGFYLVTSLPFFATSIAIFSSSYVAAAVNKINSEKKGFKIFRLASFLLFSGVIVFSSLQTGKASRDEEMLHDIYLIGPVIPKGTGICTTPELWHVFSFQEYFIRHFYISLGGSRIPGEEFFVSDIAPSDSGYKKINIPTKKYHLYKAIR